MNSVSSPAINPSNQRNSVRPEDIALDPGGLASRSPATIVADPDYGPGKPFDQLPGTLAEAKAIEGHLGKPRTLTGGQATKAARAAATSASAAGREL